MKQRLAALDWMRGLVMMIMVTDHASEAFNADRLVADSALFPSWEEPFSTVQFLFRWMSHLCAPVFVFLAGTSVALSQARRMERGADSLSIDRDLLVRGLIIVGVDLTFIHLIWFPNGLLLQVMFAIGSSFLLMIPFRRLSSRSLLLVAVMLLVLCEFTRAGSLGQLSTPRRLLQGALFDAGYYEFEFTDKALMIAYPVLPWCAIMMMGFVLGRWLNVQSDKRLITKRLLILGVGSLAFFGVVRGVNASFGNLGLTRVDGSLVRWLQVSKYPPSLTFVSLELGIMLLLLAAFFRIEHARKGEANQLNPFLVFGQTAFFFYVAHIFLLEMGARQTKIYMAGTLSDAVLATLIALVVLYPICLLYRHAKQSYPLSPLRYF